MHILFFSPYTPTYCLLPLSHHGHMNSLEKQHYCQNVIYEKSLTLNLPYSVCLSVYLSIQPAIPPMASLIFSIVFPHTFTHGTFVCLFSSSCQENISSSRPRTVCLGSCAVLVSVLCLQGTHHTLPECMNNCKSAVEQNLQFHITAMNIKYNLYFHCFCKMEIKERLQTGLFLIEAVQELYRENYKIIPPKILKET